MFSLLKYLGTSGGKKNFYIIRNMESILLGSSF